MLKSKSNNVEAGLARPLFLFYPLRPKSESQPIWNHELPHSFSKKRVRAIFSQIRTLKADRPGIYSSPQSLTYRARTGGSESDEGREEQIMLPIRIVATSNRSGGGGPRHAPSACLWISRASGSC